MTHTIVLAHGLFGFGAPAADAFGSLMPLRYFNGVAEHLRKSGYQVEEPQVPPVGDIKTRGEALGKLISELPGNGRIDIIAHSMGGLDARHALAHMDGVADRVTALVTIGTPHLGAVLADRITPIKWGPPTLLRAQFGAIADLTEEAAKEFNARTRKAPGVRYLGVACDAAKRTYGLLPLELIAALAGQPKEVSDGLVPRSSALYDADATFPDWPVDHFGAIGWFALTPDDKPRVEHLVRYNAILEKLLTIPAKVAAK